MATSRTEVESQFGDSKHNKMRLGALTEDLLKESSDAFCDEASIKEAAKIYKELGKELRPLNLSRISKKEETAIAEAEEKAKAYVVPYSTAKAYIKAIAKAEQKVKAEAAEEIAKQKAESKAESSALPDEKPLHLWLFPSSIPTARGPFRDPLALPPASYSRKAGMGSPAKWKPAKWESAKWEPTKWEPTNCVDNYMYFRSFRTILKYSN